VDPLSESSAGSTGLDLLLWARLHSAGLPIPTDRARLGRELAQHLVRQDVLRAATAGLGVDDGPAWPGHAAMAARLAERHG
jgi:hypothetical protein